MTGACDVEGCGSDAIATLHDVEGGKRCRGCLEYDLNAEKVGRADDERDDVTSYRVVECGSSVWVVVSKGTAVETFLREDEARGFVSAHRIQGYECTIYELTVTTPPGSLAARKAGNKTLHYPEHLPRHGEPTVTGSEVQR